MGPESHVSRYSLCIQPTVDFASNQYFAEFVAHELHDGKSASQSFRAIVRPSGLLETLMHLGLPEERAKEVLSRFGREQTTIFQFTSDPETLIGAGLEPV